MEDTRYFVLDLETKGDKKLQKIADENIKIDARLKDEDKIKESMNKKMATDPDYNEVICVGLKELGKEGKLYSLKEMEAWFKENKREIEGLDIRFITFNGKGFDLPVLIKAGLKNKLKFPYRQLKRMTKKYELRQHYDLMEIFDSGFKSLDLLLQIYLGIKKKEIDFNTASEKEIKTHCLEDLINTEKAYLFIEPVLTHYTPLNYDPK